MVMRSIPVKTAFSIFIKINEQNIFKRHTNIRLKQYYSVKKLNLIDIRTKCFNTNFKINITEDLTKQTLV